MAAAGLGAIVFAPYATLHLPHNRALQFQAGLVLFAVVLIVASVASGWRQVGSAPALVLAGLGLYSTAALQSALVALVRQNSFSLLSGQLFSLLLANLYETGCKVDVVFAQPSFRGETPDGGDGRVAGCIRFVKRLHHRGTGAGAATADRRVVFANRLAVNKGVEAVWLVRCEFRFARGHRNSVYSSRRR